MTDDELKELRRMAAEIEEYERTHADPARDAAEEAEWTKLQAQYPGEFVAYLDTWDGKTLVRRVLAHAPSHGELSKALAHLSEKELDEVSVAYGYPPNQALCTRALTSPRPVPSNTPQD
jgi:hypothetical protein